MSYKTINNFLDKNHFNTLKNLIFDLDFPWRRRDRMTLDTSNKMYFTHCFYNNTAPRSEFYEPYITPILKKLEAGAPLQIRANMFISALFKKSEFHRDYEDTNSKTAILYLNDCDGGTEIKINNKNKFIQAKENKILIFNTSVLHRAVSSIVTPIRYIINLNYYER